VRSLLNKLLKEEIPKKREHMDKLVYVVRCDRIKLDYK